MVVKQCEKSGVLFDLTQLQTLGIALYQCVEVLTMISAAAEEGR